MIGTAYNPAAGAVFPAELTERRQWLCWRFVQKPGQKKPSKMPYYASGMLRGGKQGSPDDRAKLVDYNTALAAVESGRFDGLGFAFLPDDGLIGIDLDACNESDERSDYAADLIQRCASYTELSPSGNGYHIIVKGHTKTFKSNALGIEVFCGSQFFTMTGNAVDGCEGILSAIPEDVLADLHYKVKGDSEPEKRALSPAAKPGCGVAKVESALAMISPDCGYDDWIRIGMAIHSELGDGSMHVWDHWSSRGASYKGARDIESHWRSFSPGSVTGATLFKIAMDNGWRPPRERPAPAPRYSQPAPTPAPAAYHPPPTFEVDHETGEVIGAANDNGTPVALAKVARLSGIDLAAVDWFSPFPDVTGKGRPLATIENLREACGRLGVTVRYNVINKEIEIIIPGEGFTLDNQANASLAVIISACNRFGIPVGQIGDFLCYLADKNTYNPVANWITSRPWDGTPRIQMLMDTIKAEGQDTDMRVLDLKEAILRRWLISAVAGAFLPGGVSAHGVLVFQGDQYVGKTAWFKALVPAELGLTQDGLMLRPDDRDSVKQAVSYWLVELGELDATFRKSDIAQLKAFLTRDKDTLRRAYAKLESHYARRTVFFASVNPRQFLHDPTGNRRYWTISVAEVNAQHGLDMQQVWAEVYETLYLKGEDWRLTREEMGWLNDHNRDHEVLDPIRERLMTRMDWQAHPSEWRWMTATDIMMELGFDRPSRADVTQCGQIVQELNGAQRKRTNGKALTKVPPPIRPASAQSSR